MKICIICDTHFGARTSSPHYLRYFQRFYSKVFFPYLDKHNIKTIIHLGDVFDNRKVINYKVLDAFKTSWIDEIEKREITVHSILGNHDVYYRNTNETNSQQLLLSGSNSTVYPDPTEIEIDGLKIALLPWVNKSNLDASLEFIKKTKAPVLMGHLELAGYQVMKGITHDHGMDPSIFSKFTKVFSGHFHVKQQKGNVDYLGTPYEITFADCGLKKGFHIFDTKTLELEFVLNPETMHEYIPYDDTKVDYSIVDVSEYRGKAVKVNVINKTDSYVYEKFIDRLLSVEPIKYTINDLTESREASGGDNPDAIDPKDTMAILTEYVEDNFKEEEDRKEIISLMKELYNEAVNIGDSSL